MDYNSFGYPSICCCSQQELSISPYNQDVNSLRVMLIGQDPTIRNNPDKVHTVLMLDQPNNPLNRWIKNIVFGGEFDRPTLYATNLVKCPLEKVPSSTRDAEAYLRPYFVICKQTIKLEIQKFQPDIVITFGQPSLRLFRSECIDVEGASTISHENRRAFTGDAYATSAFGVSFDYVPCVHMNTAKYYKDLYERPLLVLREYLRRRIHACES